LSAPTAGLDIQAWQTAAMKARTVVLKRDMGAGEAFRIIVGNCLQQMQDNEVGVAQGSDPECIHQLRVGIRRLRLALRLAAPGIAVPTALQRELAWLHGELGAARDADVLADNTLLTGIEDCPQEPDLLPLRQLAATIAGRKRRHAAAAVASLRHSRLMLALAGCCLPLRGHGSLDGATPKAVAEPLEKQATRILMLRHEKLLRSGKRLVHGTPAERHQVRIAAKKMRYATEFFQSLLPAKTVKRFVGRLAALQDALGWLNDAAVADRLLHEIALAHPELAGSAAFARGYLCAATRQDGPGLAKLWERFRSMAPP
jgi:CHAD domain-containing protein